LVAAELQRDGHHVEAVTLSGLELDGPVDVDRPPNLDTHIDQVAEIIDRRGETPLALCGHSYGGMVIAGVADRLGDRLDQLVFIDAYVPDDGDSCWSLTSDIFRESFIAGARADGRWVAVPDGLDPRARPHPMASFVQSIRLGVNPAARSVERSSVVARGEVARS
jgi:pimeloyl-ACP methyl ester carboxylesterase